MGDVKNYEDEYTSAYCRLIFITWYQGYTDDVSEHLKERSMEGALKSAEINNWHKKKIYVDGNKCIEKYGKKECVQAMIDFLYFKEDYEIICASYYSLQIELSNMAYEIVSKEIALKKYYDEMNEPGAFLTLWKYESSKAEDIYLKAFWDNIVLYAYRDLNQDIIVKKIINISDSLKNKLINWSKNYIKEKCIEDLFMGEAAYRCEGFIVDFDFNGLGFKKKYNLLSNVIRKISGNGALSELFALPDLSEFISVCEMDKDEADNTKDIEFDENEKLKNFFKPTITRSDGKDICNKLREIRKEFAAVNGIEYKFRECTYEGECTGTCELCEAEAADLYRLSGELDDVLYPDVELED